MDINTGMFFQWQQRCVFSMCLLSSISCGSQKQLVNWGGAHTIGGSPPTSNHTHTHIHSCCTGVVDGIVKALWHL